MPAKKVTNSTSVETKERAPKKVVKRVTAAPKKAVKAPAKKRVSSTTRPKKTARKATSKKPTSSKTITTSALESGDVVALPSNMSVRTITKAAAWDEFFHQALPVIAERVAKTSAWSFMLVGATFCALSLVPAGVFQSAQLYATAGSTTPLSITPTNTISQANPSVTLLESIPSVLTEAKRFAVTTNGVGKIRIIAESTATAGIIDLNAESTSVTNYRFTLDPARFLEGEYIVRAMVETAVGNHSFRLGVFSIIVTPELPPPTVPIQIDTPSTSPEAIVELDTVNTPIEQIVDDSKETEPANVPETVAPETNATSSVDSDIKEAPVDSIRDATFTISASETTVAGWVPIRVVAPSDYEYIELYLRPEGSYAERFLGRAVRSGDRWFYTMNSEHVPNGSHSITATAKKEGKQAVSNSIMLTVANPVGMLDTARRVEVATSTTQRSFLTFEDAPPRPALVSPEAATVAEDLLREQSNELNEFLKRHAVAIQSNDETLMAAVEREKQTLRQSLVSTVLTDDSAETLVTAVDVALKLRLEDLMNRVETFESIRVGRSGDAADSDGDGISDSDEILVYGTDPERADTDADGFLDGIEVIRGFNPDSPLAEAQMTYELPQTVVGLERPDVLTVSSISPFVERGESKAVSVFAEIAGRGLPNSFVTLYVFSTPIIVTVKTDADGSFVYRLEKELEDGEHEVYVAFTDNTGAILAQSQPFRFIKEAQAFIPVSNTLPGVDGGATTNTVFPYHLVFGLSIISFGLVLLMLGVSITPKREDETVPAV